MLSKFLRIFAVILAAMLMAACSDGQAEPQDGYYTAEAAEFDSHGWKEFITIYVNSGNVVTAEYNAKNSSGMIKSWDMEYMRKMNAVCGTYPNEYARIYTTSLIDRQSPSDIDAVTGATYSHKSFTLLAEAALERSKQGDKSVAFVDIPAD